MQCGRTTLPANASAIEVTGYIAGEYDREREVVPFIKGVGRIWGSAELGTVDPSVEEALKHPSVGNPLGKYLMVDNNTALVEHLQTLLDGPATQVRFLAGEQGAFPATKFFIEIGLRTQVTAMDTEARPDDPMYGASFPSQVVDRILIEYNARACDDERMPVPPREDPRTDHGDAIVSQGPGQHTGPIGLRDGIGIQEKDAVRGGSANRLIPCE